jgi:galactonate dehydratase
VPEENPRADPGTIQRNDLDTGLVVDAFGTDHLTRRPATVQDVTSNLHVNELLHSNQTAMGQTPPPIVDQVDSRLLSSRNSPEPSQTDLEGHYVGPSSGVSFLLRVQKKLHQKVSFSQNSSIFTFGDAPLPEFDPSFFVLPPKADAETLVARYFDYAVATHRFLHRPTVEAWLEEFYEYVSLSHFFLCCLIQFMLNM